MGDHQLIIKDEASSSGDMTTRLESTTKTDRIPTTSYLQMIRQWPKATFLIVSNELCERFSYYGMRTVLTLYFLNVLKYNESNSTMLFNCFTSLCYFSPLFGSILADAFIGKYKTIVILSIFYTIGQILLAVSSIQDPASKFHPWADFIGLLIIAIGTGGIKPCVSSFGGDQFDTHQVVMIALFFSVFYFAINCGSMIATFVAPIFRANPCLGQDTCYPLAFGVPALLMIVSTIIFVAGSYWYKRPKVKSNVMKDVTVVIGTALRNKFNTSEKKSHWLEHSLTYHDCNLSNRCLRLKKRRRDENACAEANFVNDVKTMFKVAIMFIPIPIYWALSDQQGSTWLIQSLQMDCRLWGDFMLIPDQMQSLNSILVLIFIPIFSGIFYPCMDKCFKMTSLRKMSLALILTTMAFISAGVVQWEVNKTLPDLPQKGRSFVSVINTFDGCTIVVGTNGTTDVSVPPHTALINSPGHRNLLDVPKGDVKFNFKYNGDCLNTLPEEVTFDVFGEVGFLNFNENGVVYSPISPDKPTEGTGEFAMGFIVALKNVDNYTGNLALCRENNETNYPCDPHQRSDFYFYQVDYDNGVSSDLVGRFKYHSKNGTDETKRAVVFKPKPVRPGKWRLYYMEGNAKSIGFTEDKENLKLNYSGFSFFRDTQGGVYVTSLNGKQTEARTTEYQVVPHNIVSILWQIPQIVLISFAEIMLSIPGLEFSYQEAGRSMKSLMSAFFQVTTGVGDLLIVIITAMNLSNNAATMFFIYASLMATATVVFICLAIFFYEYAPLDDSDDDDDVEGEDAESVNPLSDSIKKKSVYQTLDSPDLKPGEYNLGFNESRNSLRLRF
ncbi:unnamed protein product [Bursaphelenchus xylophilus]|uniref:Oligopeptide transporter 1 n=1 Tax=Bursaphelenchus xylophilus TaxID=6326 RepID=A0A1I7S048_BURXY|nr:unnamed protein product [Bursaphelenchus xylophilus]CAG9109020.1 unnamed protein product [Bursaphelenchus xylophilus]